MLLKVLLFLSNHIPQIIALLNDLSILLVFFLLQYSNISDILLGVASPHIPLFSLHTSFVYSYSRKIWQIPSSAFEHNVHISGPIHPFLCKLSHVRVSSGLGDRPQECIYFVGGNNSPDYLCLFVIIL